VCVCVRVCLSPWLCRPPPHLPCVRHAMPPAFFFCACVILLIHSLQLTRVCVPWTTRCHLHFFCVCVCVIWLIRALMLTVVCVPRTTRCHLRACLYVCHVLFMHDPMYTCGKMPAADFYVWHDSFIHDIWLVCICVTCSVRKCNMIPCMRVAICDMTPRIHVARCHLRFHVCDKTHMYMDMNCNPCMFVTCSVRECDITPCMCVAIYDMNPCIRVARCHPPSYVCDMTHSCMTLDLSIWDMPPPYAWHDSCIWDMTHSYAWHDAFIWDMTHSYAWHDSFIWDMTHS